MQLDGVSVTINGSPAYVEFYCSAVTSTVCAADQINVQSPLDSTPEVVDVVVSNSAGTSPAFSANRNAVSPSLPRFGGSRYVMATHADYSLLGPASLYPGYSSGCPRAHSHRDHQPSPAGCPMDWRARWAGIQRTSRLLE
jgi:uncharacterized protein (TIGR03437 family)